MGPLFRMPTKKFFKKLKIGKCFETLAHHQNQIRIQDITSSLHIVSSLFPNRPFGTTTTTTTTTKSIRRAQFLECPQKYFFQEIKSRKVFRDPSHSLTIKTKLEYRTLPVTFTLLAPCFLTVHFAVQIDIAIYLFHSYFTRECVFICKRMRNT